MDNINKKEKAENQTLPFELGRVIVEDVRDKKFPLSAKISTASSKTHKYWWDNGWWGDQGRTSMCVAYSWVHYLEDGPVTQYYDKKRTFSSEFLHESVAPGKHQSLFKPDAIYHAAQKVDAWPGENYKGTSVRAGAKVLKKLGVITEYRWASTLNEVIQAVLTTGPVVVGTWWYSDMFRPKDKGLITATGTKSGGHAYLLNGVNVKKKLFRIKNSWGQDWGIKGHAYISFDDFEKLLQDQGEACVAFEKKL